MEKIPTAEDFLRSKGCGSKQVKDSPDFFYDVTKEDLIEFAKLHVEAALKKASEEVHHNIDIDWVDPYDYSAGHNGLKGRIDLDSILNAYSLENIK